MGELTTLDEIFEAYDDKQYCLGILSCEQKINDELDELLLEASNESYYIKTLFNAVKILTGFKQYTELDDFVVKREHSSPSTTDDAPDDIPEQPKDDNVIKKSMHIKNTHEERVKVNKITAERVKKLEFAFKRMDRQFESRWVTRYNSVLDKKVIENINKKAKDISSSTQLELTSEFIKSLGLKKTYGPLLTFATKTIVSKSSILKPDRYNVRDIIRDYNFKGQDTALLESALKSALYKTDVVFNTDGNVSILVAQPYKRDNRLNLLNAKLYKGTLKVESMKTTAGVDSLSSYGVDHNTLAFYMSITYDEYVEYYNTIIKEREILNGLLNQEHTRLEPRFIGIYFWYISAAYRFNTLKLTALVMVLRDLKSIVSKLKI